jgi:nucleotide-binding universal stress UspA family protein
MKTKILVATDGNDASIGALRMALALAGGGGMEVRVLSVVEPFPLHGAEADLPTDATLDEVAGAARRALLRRVLHQVAGLGRGAAAWKVTVESGLAAPTIARFARRAGASMIVMGQGRHALADRWFGSEMALRVMRLAHVPVLAVPAGCTDRPRSAVVAADFSGYSADAARVAASLVGQGGEVRCVHVVSDALPTLPPYSERGWLQQYRESIEQQLARFAATLVPVSGCRVVTQLLQGDPARELLRLARELNADLVAAGSHGSGFFSRLLLGSVSTRLVRGATCAVLIAPPRTVPGELREDPESVPADEPRMAAV